jgi:Flp pilus assembly protein TadD
VTLLLGALALWAFVASALTAQEEPAAVVDSALERVAAGDTAGAIALLEGADTGEAQVAALLGALYLESGRAGEALERLAPLAVSDRADAAVLYNAGRAAMALDRPGEAHGYLTRAARLAPGSPAERELGLLLARGDRCREAYVHLQPWALTHPVDLEARLAAASCAVELERAPAAEELLSGLPQDDRRVQLLWGELLLLKGDPWGALAALEPLAEASPEPDPRLRRLLAEGHLVVGQSSSAIELLAGRAEGDPASLRLLSAAYYQNGDLESALSTIEPVAAPLVASGGAGSSLDDAVLAELVLEYGRLLVVAGRAADALPALSLATRLRGDDPPAWETLGQALSATGRAAEADDALARSRELSATQRRSADGAELDAFDPTGREVRRGFFLAREGSAAEALDLARQELVLAPGDFRPYLLEAMALLVLERPSEALQSAQRAVELAPDNADAFYQRGITHIALGDPEQAEADLRQAMAIAPEHTAAMNDLAILLLSRGARDEARELLERVLEINPSDRVAADNLAELGGPVPE